MSLPASVSYTLSNLVVLKSGVTSVITEIRQKKRSIASRLSRLLNIKVIPTDTDRLDHSIGYVLCHDFPLMIHSNKPGISYCFRDKRRSVKNCKFSPTTPPLKGSHWNFVMAVLWAQPTKPSKSVMVYVHSFKIQTDVRN